MADTNIDEKPPVYEDKWEKAPLHHDPHDCIDDEDPEQGREEDDDEEEDMSDTKCRIACYIGFFVLWALIYAYFLHVPTLGRKLFQRNAHVEMPIKAIDTNTHLNHATAFNNINAIQTAFSPPQEVVQNMDGVSIEIEDKVIVDKEHGIIIEEITLNIPESERAKLLQTQKDRKGLFGRPERSFPFPGFIQARRRNPFEALMRHSRKNAEEPVMLVLEVDQDGNEKGEDIVVPQDILL